MRSLKSTLLALLAAVALAIPVQAQRNAAASEKLGIELGMQCYTYRAVSTFEVFERMQKFGIKFAEMYPGQKMKPGSDRKTGTDLTDAEIAELLAKAKDCGVKIVSFGVTGMPTDEAGLRKLFDWAKKVGLEKIVTETYPTEATDKITKEYGIKVAIHNHPQRKNDEKYKVWDPNFVLSLVKDKNPLIGSCSDTGHWIRSGLKPVECLKILEGRVMESHFKDLDEKKSDVVYGLGVGDSKGVIAELKRQNAKVVMNIEYEHGDVAHLDETMPKCVAAFDKICAEVAGN